MNEQKKLYPERDPTEFVDYYMRHVEAMTSEELFGKGDIAVQLAWRDREIDQLRKRVAEAEADNERLRRGDITVNTALDACDHFAGRVRDAETKLALADKWARAWRNRFIDERMAAYTEASYEMKRCYAESDANDFEAAFDAAIDASGHDSLPPHK